MNRFTPRSPGARLAALRRALWDEDAALGDVLATAQSVCVATVRNEWLALPADVSDAAREAFDAARDRRMEAEREMWEARAGHGLD